ncbi:hypothetical protein AOZ06_45120 [Kibdelosporangium phytohabitans]|uniref:Signal peptidase I n=1 Tax=Kibdelosporangium phytohabitans TaxID=860235 RepID=A0A0N9IEB4_9PSEU|nr:hypothetical protein AOZ06_45120 [Kibdelosporangium phytohabitans]
MAVMVTGVLIAATAFMVLGFGYRRLAEPSDAMLPTVGHGDKLTIREVSGGDVNRGDVVIFSAAAWGQPDVELVRRVVGVGGDAITCCELESFASVNGRQVTEEYVKVGGGSAARRPYTATVEPGHVWVLGDNRGTARDSRDEINGPAKGGIPVGDIKGVVVRAGDGRIEQTTAFSRVGLPGKTFEDGRATWMGLMILVGGLTFLASAGWLLVTIRRRTP